MTWCLVFRYLLSHSNRHRSRTLRIIIGLAVSTLLMSVTLSVMEYLQSSRFDEVCRVQSFPVIVETSSLEEARALLDAYPEVPGFIYKEDIALMEIGVQGGEGVSVRYIDSGYKGYLLTSRQGAVPTYGIMLPFRTHGTSYADVTLTRLGSGQAARIVPHSSTWHVEGWFQTSLPDFDASHVFLPLSQAPDGLPWICAFMCEEGQEEVLVASIEESGLDAVPWWEAESALHGAMMLEEAVMTALLSTLYIIISVQVVQSALMLSRTKRRESVTLYLLGMERWRVVVDFGLVGVMMSVLAASLGIVFSLVILHFLPYAPFARAGGAAVFHLPWATVLVLAGLMTLLSFISYAAAFRSNLGKERVEEALDSNE